MKSNISTFERENVQMLVQASGLIKHFAAPCSGWRKFEHPIGRNIWLVVRMALARHHHPAARRRVVADQGDVTICGYDLRKQVELARSTLGYLSQRFSMYEDLTVLENIRFFAEIRGLTSTEWEPRSMEILKFVAWINLLTAARVSSPAA